LIRFAAFALFCVLLTSTTTGSAAPESVRRALELGYQADDLYMRGRWSEAYDAYERAEQLVHSPVFVLSMARSKKNAGKLIDALPLYERALREPLDASSPKPFRDAVAAAALERDEVLARIALVRVILKGPDAARATVRIDGRVVAAAAAIPIDPGTHAFAASVADRQVDKTVTLAGGPAEIELDLGAGATAERRGRGSLVPAAVALSVGVVGIGVGAVTGGIAAARASDIDASCREDKHCPRSAAPDIDSAKTVATTSTVSFIAGGVGLAAAVVLFVVRPGGTPRGQGGSCGPWCLRASF